MRVSILMPVKDDLEGLRVTLQSLAGLDKGSHEVEVIVCNDGGPPDVSAMARQMGCRVAELPENRGSYAARNQGLRMATGEVLAFVDADQCVDPGWLIAGLAALAGADYVGGAVEIVMPTEPTAWEAYDRLAAFPVRYYLEERHFAPTANLFVRRGVFERIGCFEEALKSGGDREFGVRVHRAGMRMAYCAAAVTLHPARDFGEQARKVSRVARGAAELEYLVWKRPATVLLGDALAEMLKALPRAFVRAWRARRAAGPWHPRHHFMRALVALMFQWARIRHLLSMLQGRVRVSWASRVPALGSAADERTG